MNDTGFDEELLDQLDPAWRRWLELRARTGSTNDVAFERARAGAAHGAAVAAACQTAGRGRQGATWHSPPGGALAFSIVLRPRVPIALWPRLSLVAGLVVAIELERLGLDARVKWPNDVLVGSRKVCGVLVEAGPGFVVVGVGVNVNIADFPPELAASATSVARELGRQVDREPLLVGIRNGLLRWLDEATDDFAAVLAALGERCALRGTRVRATGSQGRVEGVVRGFGPGGELVIEQAGRFTRLLQADEIRPAPEHGQNQ